MEGSSSDSSLEILLEIPGQSVLELRSTADNLLEDITAKLTSVIGHRPTLLLGIATHDRCS